jgi:hypothetical protein
MGRGLLPVGCQVCVYGTVVTSYGKVPEFNGKPDSGNRLWDVLEVAVYGMLRNVQLTAERPSCSLR